VGRWAAGGEAATSLLVFYEFGLTQVPTEDLKTLLRYLHRGELRCPLTPAELARFGLQVRSASLLNHLRGLDATGVRAVVVGILAERMEADERQALAAELAE